MVVNFLRTAVGIDTVETLYDFQQDYRLIQDADGHDCVALHTRNMPLRANDLMNGGSVYWIISRFIQARQVIVDVAKIKDTDGRDICRILMQPEIVLVAPVPHRHIQGWRYLDGAKAPADRGMFNPDISQSLPDDPEMARALRDIGLL